MSFHGSLVSIYIVEECGILGGSKLWFIGTKPCSRLEIILRDAKAVYKFGQVIKA